MQVEPYLSFEGRCDEALEFYRAALDAQVLAVMRYKESPEPGMCPDGKAPPPDKVMHSLLRIGDSKVMATDGMCTGNLSFQGISLTLNVDDEARADRFFNALKEGGKVLMPLGKTFFSPRFGMVVDRFGVTWIVIVPQK